MTSQTAAGTLPTPPDGAAPPAPAPHRWWQWVLIYPTLAISTLGSVPTLLELNRAREAKVAFGWSAASLQQQDLWAKNMRCAEAPFEGQPNAAAVRVAATICKSGDVLVRFVGPEERTAYRWVPVERFDAPADKLGSVPWLGVAHAQTALMQAGGAQLACQWSPAPGWVVRRLRSGAQCVNERIRTSNGEVVAREMVRCDAPCR